MCVLAIVVSRQELSSSDLPHLAFEIRGSEDDPEFRPHSGNEPPKGYGHICIAVPDIGAACRRFEQLGAYFQKKLGEGSMKGIAFIKDPDGYWIEIVQPDLLPDLIRSATITET